MTIKETLPNGRRKTSVIINFKNPFDKEKAPFLHVNCVEMRLFMVVMSIMDVTLFYKGDLNSHAFEIFN
jgi:hypothetical protein